MAKSLSARVGLAITGLLENVLDIGASRYPFQFGPNYQFSNGNGAGQAQVLFSDTRSLAASGTEDLDLNGTALTDALGAPIALTKIKAIVIVADAGNTNDVVVGGATSNGAISMFGAATDKVKVKPGGMFMLVAPAAAGYALTADTADLLKVANSGSGTGVTYTIVIIGV